MKFGADRKRLALLAGLVLVGAYVIWSNLGSDSSNGQAAASRPAAGPAQTGAAAGKSRTVTRRAKGQNRPGEWSAAYVDPGVSIDPVKVDPTLRLDLLAKVQQVEVSGSQRNLFQFGESAPTTPLAPLPPNPGKIKMPGGKPPVMPVVDAGPPKPPPPPPITLKYYGYSNPRNSTRRRAFFLDGEDIIVASEGELIKKRYRLVKIGVNSVTMEDTQFKNEQTLPLAEDAIAG